MHVISGELEPFHNRTTILNSVNKGNSSMFMMKHIFAYSLVGKYAIMGVDPNL